MKNKIYFSKKTTFRYSLVCFLLLSNALLHSQESWETYITKKENGFMSVAVNMDLNFSRPNYKNVLIVGTQTSKCLKNGAPTEKGLEKLYTFSDSIAFIVNGLTKNKLAGIITYKCAGFDVFYVKDTTSIRKEIDSFIKKNYTNSKNYLLIEHDKKWKYYQESLFPKDLSNDFFVNHEFLNQLFYDGDKLTEVRKIEHWLYFRKEKKRQKFIAKIQALNFKVDSIKYKKRDYLPYELKISRKDSITPKAISKLTAMLQIIAKAFSGTYDGWGAEPVIKEPFSKTNQP